MARFQVRAPRWLAWQVALAAGGEGAAALLESCLLACIDGPVTRAELQALPATEGDELLTQALALIEAERAALRLEVTGRRVTGEGIDLLLQPWTFGERNAALRDALRLMGGQVTIDLLAFERATLLGCVRLADGRPLSPAALEEWPVPLGEAVLGALDRLTRTDGALLQAAIAQGLPHPDLSLVQLCRAFGWTPEQVERLEAPLAERLLAVVGALGLPSAQGVGLPVGAWPQQAAPSAQVWPGQPIAPWPFAGSGQPTAPWPSPAAPRAQQPHLAEGVTRIVIDDA